MTVEYLACPADSWFSLYNASNRGNGSGPRLVVGYSTSGSDTFKNRAGLSFSDWPRNDARVYTEVLLRLRVKGAGSCWGKGASPNIWVERTASQETIVENGNTDDCTVSTAGTADAKYPGPTTTTTNRVAWSGTPAVDDVVSIDITAMWNDWYATRPYGVNNNFTVVLKANNETSTGDRIVFYSRHHAAYINAGGDNPELKVTYTSNQPPDTPTCLTPSGRVTGATTPTMDFTATDPDEEDCYQCYVQVSTDQTFASVTHWDSGWVSPTSVYAGPGLNPTYNNRATKTYGGTGLTRGTQYYWRVKIRDVALDASSYSTAMAFDVNEYPVGTKVAP